MKLHRKVLFHTLILAIVLSTLIIVHFSGTPPMLSIIGGNNQGDLPGITLSKPISVRVDNMRGIGAYLTFAWFTITPASGTVSPEYIHLRPQNSQIVAAHVTLPSSKEHVGDSVAISAHVFSIYGMSSTTFTAVIGNPDIGPKAPTNVHCTRRSSTEVLVEWTDICNNETAFYVERSEDNQTWKQIATLPANAISYIDTNLPANEVYSYRIVAHNDAP